VRRWSLLESHEKLRGVCFRTLDKVLDRGNRLETLVDATETLDTHTTNFKSVSTTLKRNLWWKNMKMWILLFLTIGVRAATPFLSEFCHRIETRV